MIRPASTTPPPASKGGARIPRNAERPQAGRPPGRIAKSSTRPDGASPPILDRLSPYTWRPQIEEAVRFHHHHGYVHFANYGFVNMLHLAVSVPKKISPSAAVSVILASTPTLDPSAQAAEMRAIIDRLA